MKRFYVTTALVAVLAFVPSTAAAQIFESTQLRRANGDTVTVDLGTIRVPENRSAPDSRQIPIRFVRLQSRAEDPAAPIVYLAGGPGGSGIRAWAGERGKMFNQLRDVADVIILDQRGTGLSDETPECESSARIPSDSALTRDLYVRLHRAAVQECYGFWKDKGVDIRGYTTWESTADINAVRKALGVERVNLLGISYGSHLALATLKRYPRRVDRLVLSSAEGLNQTVKLPARTDAYVQRLQAAIDADSASHSYYPDVRGLIGSVLAEVESDPPTLTVETESGTTTRTLGPFFMRLMTGYMFSDPSRAGSILEAYLEASNGNYQEWRRFLDDDTVSLDGMSLAMDLASGISTERRARVQAQADTALLGDALNFPMPHLQGAIPGIDLGEDFRSPVRSDRPTLFLSGTLDGRTYLEAHAEIAEGFSNGAIVTIENAGHNLFFSHPEVVDIIADFFAGAPAKRRTLTAPAPSFVPD
jgi:pimeloyl-ACP methyl ester carboxylesterase